MVIKTLFLISFMSILLKEILSLEEAKYEKVVIDSNFFSKENVTKYIAETICAITCSKKFICLGYMPYENSKSGCTQLNPSESSARVFTVTVEVMWDRMRIHKRLNGKRYTKGNPIRMGYNRNWRLCHTGCLNSGAVMTQTPKNDKRLKFYNLYENTRIWIDGLRQIGRENYFDTKGVLVLDPNTTELAVNIQADNTKMTGLVAYEEVISGLNSEEDIHEFSLLCICIPPISMATGGTI